MSDNRALRNILLVLMDLLIVIALLLVARLVVEFFGVLASQSWSRIVLALSKPFVLPFGVKAIATPYGGFFDANAALSVLAFLFVEWAVSLARRAA